MCGVAADRLRDGKAKFCMLYWGKEQNSYLDSEFAAVDIVH